MALNVQPNEHLSPLSELNQKPFEVMKAIKNIDLLLDMLHQAFWFKKDEKFIAIRDELIEQLENSKQQLEQVTKENLNDTLFKTINSLVNYSATFQKKFYNTTLNHPLITQKLELIRRRIVGKDILSDYSRTYNLFNLITINLYYDRVINFLIANSYTKFISEEVDGFYTSENLFSTFGLEQYLSEFYNVKPSQIVKAIMDWKEESDNYRPVSLRHRLNRNLKILKDRLKRFKFMDESTNLDNLIKQAMTLPRLGSNPLSKIIHYFSIIASQASKSELDWIQKTHKRGYILNNEEITRLENDLESPNNKIKRTAARTIIEEVILQTEKGAMLRLKALKELKPFLKKNSLSPISNQTDLHNHTSLSDAYITPTALIVEAFEQNLEYIAVTDHERLTAPEAIEASKILGVKLIGGVEASCFYEGVELHLIIIYNPNKNIQKSLSEQSSNILKKLEFMDNDNERRAEDIRVSLPKYLGEEYSISYDEALAASRGKLVPMTPCNALWNKDPNLVTKLLPAATSGKDFLVSFLKNDPRPIYPQTDTSNTLSIFEVARLSYELNGRIIMAHPNELDNEHSKAIDVMVNILKELYSVSIDGVNVTGLIAGIETFSHKAKQSGIQTAIIKSVQKLNETQFKKTPLLLLPGSDYHGNYSLPDHPLGNKDNYPSEDRLIVEMLKIIRSENPNIYNVNHRIKKAS